MNTPVSFENAKLLKEKGFNEECKYYYDVNGGLNFHIGYIDDIWKNSEIKNGLPYHKEEHRSPCISAPTIAEVVMWLYEKHRIWISVDFKETDETFQNCCRLLNSENLPRIFCNDSFNSPTEAYNAAIEYALNNLI